MLKCGVHTQNARRLAGNWLANIFSSQSSKQILQQISWSIRYLTPALEFHSRFFGGAEIPQKKKKISRNESKERWAASPSSSLPRKRWALGLATHLSAHFPPLPPARVGHEKPAYGSGNPPDPHAEPLRVFSAPPAASAAPEMVCSTLEKSQAKHTHPHTHTRIQFCVDNF